MKIVVADANLVPHRTRFEAAMPSGSQVVWHPSLDELRDADVYVGSGFTAEMAGAAEKLRLIHVAGAGTDKVDFAALGPDVLVANTFHHERSIAEYVVAAAVMLRRDFLAQDRQLRRGVWATSVYDPSIPQQGTLADAHIGFVGFGHIGRYAWNMLQTLGCTGSAVTDSGRVPECGLAWVSSMCDLDRLLSECDVAVVSAPLRSDTEGMIGPAQLNALGRVWYRYPASDAVCAPSGLPFAELPNVLMTPHSWASPATRSSAGRTTWRRTSDGCSGASVWRMWCALDLSSIDDSSGEALAGA